MDFFDFMDSARLLALSLHSLQIIGSVSINFVCTFVGQAFSLTNFQFAKRHAISVTYIYISNFILRYKKSRSLLLDSIITLWALMTNSQPIDPDIGCFTFLQIYDLEFRFIWQGHVIDCVKTWVKLYFVKILTSRKYIF